MYPVSPGWRWRPISRTRRGVAHLCTFPPSGEVLLPNCPPPGGGLDIRWWKSCLFECALPGGTVRRPFYRGGRPDRRYLPWPFTGAEGNPAGGCMRRPFTGAGDIPAGGCTRRPFTGKCIPTGGTRRGHLPGRGREMSAVAGGTMRRPCRQSTGQDRTQLLSACLPPGSSHGHPRRAS